MELIVGLNPATRPSALRRLRGVTGVAIRYFTSRFHAKIYVFDRGALLGSSNLTDGGLRSNREAVILLDQDDDADDVDEIRALFVELWNAALVLTPEKLDGFERIQGNSTARHPNRKRGSRRRSARPSPTTSMSPARRVQKNASSSNTCDGKSTSGTVPPSARWGRSLRNKDSAARSSRTSVSGARPTAS